MTRCEPRGDPAIEAGWLFSRLGQHSLATAQAAGELDAKTGTEAGGTFTLQFEDSQELPVERRFSVVLVVQVALLGGSVFGQMVYENDAIEDRANEENGTSIEATSPPAAKTVPETAHKFF